MKDQAKRTEIGTLGEFGLIKHLTKDFRKRQESTLFGVGDDAAVLAFSDDQHLLVSTDLLMEGIHFDLMYTPLKHLGYKSVIVNLSDIYAMNGTPEQFTFSMAISNRFSVEALDEIYEGIHAACIEYGVDLVGGDTTSSKSGLLISVSAIGKVNKNKITYRHTAKVGDLICVSGDLGGAYLGLQLLEREKQIFLENPKVQPDLEDQDYVVGRQLKPFARKDIMEALEREGILPTSMIDVSDGVSSDLMHICEASKVGCHVYEENLPIGHQTFQLAMKFSIDPSTCALNGGEDYELLFTVDKEDRAKLDVLSADITVIGQITEASEGIKLVTKQGKHHDMKAQGWNHVSNDSATKEEGQA